MERVKRTHALLGIAIFLLVSIYGATRVYATEGETIIIDMESSASETTGESTYAESSAAETSNIQESSSTTGETGSKNNGKININGVWYNSFAEFYEASGYIYIEKSDLINVLKKQYANGGTVNESYFYVDSAGENLVSYLVNRSGLYSSFASIAYKYTIRTTAGNATVGGYQVMCFETDTTTQMYLTDSERSAVDGKANAILSSCRAGSNTETVKNVFNWFKNNVSYDYSYTRGNAYDALITNNCVCAGYASAFQYIMEKAGIPCYIVTGLTNTGVGHAWNAVYVNNSWYYVDCTYGAGYKSDSWLLFGTNMLSDIYGIGISSNSYDSAHAGTAADVEVAENKYYSGHLGGVTTTSSMATIVLGSDTNASTISDTTTGNVAADQEAVATEAELVVTNDASDEKLLAQEERLELELNDSLVDLKYKSGNATTAKGKYAKEKSASYNKQAAVSALIGLLICLALGIGLIIKRITQDKLFFKRLRYKRIHKEK